MARERLVIVGNGMVGLRFVEELGRAAPDLYDVTVVGAEPNPAYNRVLLSPLLAEEIGEADTRFRDRRWYPTNGMRLVIGAPATKIDFEERELIVGGRTLLPFDRLVLATGSEPIRLPKPGMDLPGVVTFRRLEDVEAIRAAARAGARAVVIGGGLLGIEAAAGLARLGTPVTLVHLMDRLMERQLDARGAAFLRRAVEARGVDVVLGADTAAVEGAGRAEAVRLTDSRAVPAELVVVAVGVRPQAALAASSGIEVKRGVVIDDGLETSAPGVYAIGECVEHRGQTYGLVEPGYEQARVLAQRLAGEDVVYDGSRVGTNLKVSGVPVFSAGDIEAREGDEVVTFSDPAAGAYAKLIVRGSHLVGAILVGEANDALYYLDLIRNGADITPIRDELIFGRAAGAAPLARAA